MLAVYSLALLFVMKQSVFYFDLLRALKGSLESGRQVGLERAPQEASGLPELGL
jgi:hypothetical protein